MAYAVSSVVRTPVCLFGVTWYGLTVLAKMLTQIFCRDKCERNIQCLCGQVLSKFLCTSWCGSAASAAVLPSTPLPPPWTRRAKLLPCQALFSWAKTADGRANGLQPDFIKKKPKNKRSIWLARYLSSLSIMIFNSLANLSRVCERWLGCRKIEVRLQLRGAGGHLGQRGAWAGRGRLDLSLITTSISKLAYFFSGTKIKENRKHQSRLRYQ